MADQTATISDTSITSQGNVIDLYTLVPESAGASFSFSPTALHAYVSESGDAIFAFGDVDVINVIIESIIASASPAPLLDAFLAVTESAIALGTILNGYKADVSEVAVTALINELGLTPLPISERITAAQAINLVAELSSMLDETAVTSDSVQPGQNAYQNETGIAAISGVVALALNALISEVLEATKTVTTLLSTNVSVISSAKVSDILCAAYVELVHELVTIVKAINTSMHYTNSLSELVTASALLSHIIHSTELLSELFGATDTLNLHLEFTQAISEIAKSEFIIELGDSDYTALIFNTETEATFFYSNFPFNSFHGNIAATSDGLYRLEGDTDDGSAIDAYFETGYSDFGSNQMKRFQPGGVYIGFANDGSAVVKVSTSNNGVVEEDWYEEDVTFAAFDTERVKVHDGIKSRYWKFKVLNKEGSHLDLDTLQLFPIVLKRRLR